MKTGGKIALAILILMPITIIYRLTDQIRTAKSELKEYVVQYKIPGSQNKYHPDILSKINHFSTSRAEVSDGKDLLSTIFFSYENAVWESFSTKAFWLSLRNEYDEIERDQLRIAQAQNLGDTILEATLKLKLENDIASQEIINKEAESFINEQALPVSDFNLGFLIILVMYGGIYLFTVVLFLALK